MTILFFPVPIISDRSITNSLAIFLTAGPAFIPEKFKTGATSVFLSVLISFSVSSSSITSCFKFFSFSSSSSSTSITAKIFPSETLSPSFTFISLIFPEKSDGTSIAAFSDSSTTMGSFFEITSPGCTEISIISVSCASPRFGIFISTKFAMDFFSSDSIFDL